MRDMTDPREVAEPYPLEEPDKSLGDLAGRLSHEVGELISDHLRLVRVEVVEDLKKAGRGAGMLGGGAVAGWIAALLLSLAAAWGLAEVMAVWLAFLVVAVVWLVTAGILIVTGKKALEEIDPVPTETLHELERDKEWISEQI
ncbi:hypothetical protein BH23ACT5_BH23ACT5_19900 [soil metagenome]